LDHKSKILQKNNSSRDEMYEKHSRTDHTTNTQIAKELNITPVFDKIQAYRRHWLQHINRIPQNRLPRILKNYRPACRRNQG
jgi:hypothetical protein